MKLKLIIWIYYSCPSAMTNMTDVQLSSFGPFDHTRSCPVLYSWFYMNKMQHIIKPILHLYEVEIIRYRAVYVRSEPLRLC